MKTTYNQLLVKESDYAIVLFNFALQSQDVKGDYFQ